jgi:hypothetical protein
MMMGDVSREWSSRDWRTAIDAAVQRAQLTGYRYVVRRSYTRPERWLVMRRLPLQRVAS